MKVDALSLCYSGAFRCVLTQCQGEKMSALILEEQLLLPISLERVIRAFPNNLKSIIHKFIPMWETFKH